MPVRLKSRSSTINVISPGVGGVGAHTPGGLHRNIRRSDLEIHNGRAHFQHVGRGLIDQLIAAP